METLLFYFDVSEIWIMLWRYWHDFGDVIYTVA